MFMFQTRYIETQATMNRVSSSGYCPIMIFLRNLLRPDQSQRYIDRIDEA